ncbi:U-box domain-containing protein 12 [Lactuca sativa]|uniref:Protein kinase domain-containing protein n=1 Tax=Lactuca sativa TaxID=4236 RepID=A0A9R1V5H6_LACSA|nr:U-box domain-containing protein 12 [Lactuca sativa]KAJ0200572.1 hypothetical protein LSAT_V11C600320820 [Lactuca sativa]
MSSSSGVNLENYLIPLEEIKRATENFSQQRCIGGGGFGAVYKGQLSERWQNRTAAIKQLGQDSHQGEREFRNELEMISKFHHENIISFIGYCDEGNEMIIVYEYAMNGSLDHHLQDPHKIRCITWTERLMICIGAAKGLSYLHSGLGEHNRVIHRDVKSANILLDNNLVAKVCDFGLSKNGPRNQPDTQLYTRVAGTQFYMDPTYHESRILRKESDVYSFGVVLFEILCGMLVYHEKRFGGDGKQFLMTSVRRYYKKEPHKVIDPHIMEQIDSGAFDAFKEIAYQCISFNSIERPTMEKVVERIEEALTIQTNKRSACTPEVRSWIESAIHKLKSSSSYEQRMGAYEMNLLAKRNNDNRVAIAYAGVIPLLKNLLKSPDSQEQAVTTLLILSSHDNNKFIIVSSGAVPGIIHVLREGNMAAREDAAATLFSLSLIDENKVTIGSAEAIPPLVLLLREGTQKGKRDATTALFNLCIYQGNTIRAVRAGVVPVLIELVREPQGVLKDELLGVLFVLSTHPEGILAIGKAEAVPVLVEVIGSGSLKLKETAATVLGKLCFGDQKYLVEAQELGVVEKLKDLMYHGTDRGKRIVGQLLEKMTI